MQEWKISAIFVLFTLILCLLPVNFCQGKIWVPAEKYKLSLLKLEKVWNFVKYVSSHGIFQRLKCCLNAYAISGATKEGDFPFSSPVSVIGSYPHPSLRPVYSEVHSVYSLFPQKISAYPFNCLLPHPPHTKKGYPFLNLGGTIVYMVHANVYGKFFCVPQTICRIFHKL